MRDLEDIIVLAIDELEQGSTIEKILARYPEHASELMPVLKAAQQLANLKLAPSAEAKANSKRAFLAQAAALNEKPAIARRWGNPFRLLARLVAPTAVAIVLLLFGFYALAQSALPGQTLYGSKIEIEGFRLAQVQDPDALTRLAEQFEQRRRDEVKDLLERGLEADVMFGDIIAGIEDQRWELESGIPVQLTDDTVVRGRPEVGLYAHVIGRTADGIVMAGTVRVDTPLLPEVEALPEATETPEPTELPASAGTATPTNSQSPAPTKTATATPSPEPSATPSATPTSTKTPTATATPTVTVTPTSSATPTATTEASPTPDDDDGGSDDGDEPEDPPDDNSDDGSDDSVVEPGG